MSAAEVTWRDDGLALRTLRVGVHPEALVIHIGTDVVVRTPTRPDHRDGNVVDLLAPPSPDEVMSRLEGVRRLMEPVGVRHVHLRYELPAGDDGGAAEAARAEQLVAAGCRVTDLRVLQLAVSELPTDAPEPPADVTIERLAGPDGDVIDERRWYAASVLDRYAHGDDVTAWRAWDDAWGAWDRERLAALARIRRAEVWLASRHGMPVASLTLIDDQDGLVVIDRIITHPAHRRRGIARALLGVALSSLHGATSVERITLVVAADAPIAALSRVVGFTPVADVRDWIRPDEDAVRTG
jgi:ribosomal protein S18 acetylase RimI-like enzyme